MTLAEYFSFQILHAKKSRSSGEDVTLAGYYKQLASESLPSLPKGSNGVAGTAPDKF